MGRRASWVRWCRLALGSLVLSSDVVGSCARAWSEASAERRVPGFSWVAYSQETDGTMTSAGSYWGSQCIRQDSVNDDVGL